MRCNLFISHSYEMEDDYYQLVDLLSKSKQVSYVNNSLPKPKSLYKQQDITQSKIKKNISKRIKASDIFCILFDTSIEGRDWIEFEINEAKRMNKKILGIYRETNKKDDSSIADAVDNFVEWNITSIDEAALQCLNQVE